MTNKSAIEKMEILLKNAEANFALYTMRVVKGVDMPPLELPEALAQARKDIAEARRLLEQEHAQKPPMDMAGLVEEVEAWGNKAVLESNVCNINWADFDEILSRYAHPSTGKCGELVKRLRAHIKTQKEAEADYLGYEEIETILDEFEKEGI